MKRNLDKLLNHSEPQFLPLSNSNNNTCLTGLVKVGCTSAKDRWETLAVKQVDLYLVPAEKNIHNVQLWDVPIRGPQKEPIVELGLWVGDARKRLL